MLKTSLFIFLLASMIACAGLDVKRDYDPKFEFTKIKTYSVKDGNGRSLDKNSLIGQRINEALNAELNRKGLSIASSKSADLLVAVEYWEREIIEPARVSMGIGVGSGGYRNTYGGWGLGYGIPRVSEQDTIAIRFYSAKTGKEVWQGFATGNIDRKAPAKTREKIQEAVSKILEKFPSASA